MGYGDAPIPYQEQVQTAQERADERAGRAVAMNQTATAGHPDFYSRGNLADVVQSVVFEFSHPMSQEEFKDKITLTTALIAQVARIPGLANDEGRMIVRRWEDIVDRSNSQGRQQQLQSKVIKFMMVLATQVSRIDVQEGRGLSGVSSLLTTSDRVSSEVRVQQPTPQATGFWPWSKK
ncbi:MAG: hypothetical protein WCX22_01905 [Methanoregula sp.]